MKKYKGLITVLILFTVYNSFFLNKAFHIDDPFTIAAARAVNENFFKPTPIFFSSPILLGYYYAPIIKFFGEKEIWLHLFYLPFSWLVVISMYFLSRRFSKKSLLPVLFLVSTPAFIVNSHNIMLDIPLLGFFLASVASFVYGTDKSDNRFLFLSGILGGAAILTKYSGLVLLPILFIYSLLHRKKSSLFFLIIPLIILLLWILHNIIFYKQLIFFDALKYRLEEYFLRGSLIRIFACLIFISGTSIISIPLSVLLLRNKKNIILFLISLPIGASPFFLNFFYGYSLLEKYILALFLFFSFFLVLIIFKVDFITLRIKPANKDSLFLSSWFFVVLVFLVLSNFIAARFVLLLFPPFFLILYKEFSIHQINLLPNFKKVGLSLIIANFLISSILAIGDYYFAEDYRNFVYFLKKNFRADEKVYFCSTSYSYYWAWGYSYYVNKYYPMAAWKNITEELGNGQHFFFISPSQQALPINMNNICIRGELHNLCLNNLPIKRIDYFNNVALHSLKYRTGFYSHDWGLLPFKIFLKRHMLEEFSIHKIALSKTLISCIRDYENNPKTKP